MNDEELEQMMRSGLHTKAGEVEVGSEHAALARAGARTRRHTRVGLVASATAAVIVTSVVVANQVVQDRGTAPVAGPGPTQTGANWRVESYGGVQLRVPPDWGWGGTPIRDVQGDQRVYECGTGAFARPGADGQTVFNEGMNVPYVGRTGYYMTDVCQPVLPPSQPYVWFGAPIKVGTERPGGDFVQETVEVHGVRVTVGDDDPEELATIMGSLQAVDVDANGCASAVPKPSDGMASMSVESVSVCTYLREEGKDAVLGYSTSITGAAAQEVLDRIEAMPAGQLDCVRDLFPTRDTVVLRFHGQGEDTDVLARLDGCGGYYTGEGTRLYTKANVTPWLVDGVGLYVSGGQVGNALSGFYDRFGG